MKRRDLYQVLSALFCVVVLCCVLVGSPTRGYAESFTEGGGGATFSDVPSKHWAYDVIDEASSLGLMKGYKNGRFGPDDNVTRGQVAVILWHMSGDPAPSGTVKVFSDVTNPKAYYYKAVRWASSAGVVNGYSNGKFGPDDDVTREQLATMLGNYARNVSKLAVYGSDRSYTLAATGDTFEDASSVSKYAVNAMGWCFKNRILSGAGTKIVPQGNATRAQTAKMMVFLHRLVSMGRTEQTTRALELFQSYLYELKGASGISYGMTVDGLPHADPMGEPDLLYKFAVGDTDGDGFPELVFCIKGGVSPKLSGIYVAKYSPSAKGLIRDAPVTFDLDTFENVYFLDNGWALIDGSKFAPIRDDVSSKYDVREGSRLYPSYDGEVGEFVISVLSPFSVDSMRKVSGSEYQSIINDLTAASPLDMMLTEATDTNIHDINI